MDTIEIHQADGRPPPNSSPPAYYAATPDPNNAAYSIHNVKPVGGFRSDTPTQSPRPQPIEASDHPLPEVAPTQHILPDVVNHPEPVFKSAQHPSMLDGSYFATVTPLRLLGKQSDVIDCPFCLRQGETRVTRKASAKTHGWATAAFLSTGIGVVAPYVLNLFSHVDHYCGTCNKRVARRVSNGDKVTVYGTAAADRETSMYAAAVSPGPL